MTTQGLEQNTAITFRPRPLQRVFQDPATIKSMFTNFGEHFTRYKLHVRFTGKVVGGTPKDPNILRNWLTRRLATHDNALLLILQDTLREMGIELSENATPDEIAQAAKAMELAQTTGFKYDDRGLYLEARTLKAALKEVMSINFVATKLGKREGYAGKAAQGFFNERVFVWGDTPEKCHLLAPYSDGQLHYVAEPDGIERFIGHVQTAQGPRSAISMFEYVEQPEVVCFIDVHKNAIPDDVWEHLWMLLQDNGWGSKRSQSFGKLKVVAWEKTDTKTTDELQPLQFGEAAGMAYPDTTEFQPVVYAN